MIYGNFFNGISADLFNQSYFPDLKHVDVFSQMGLASCEKKPKSFSIDDIEPGIIAVTPVNTVYIFSSLSGKIWKIFGGVPTLVGTNPNGAHSGATFFNNRIYFASRTNVLGVFTAESEAALNYNLGTMSTSNTPYIPMVPNLNLGLYIGSGNLVYNVNYTGSFGITSLNFPNDYRITDMRPFGDNLAVGGYAQNQGFLALWNVYSESFFTPDLIDGPLDFWFGSSNSNMIGAVCGHEGDIFHFTGSQSVLRWRIPFVRTAPNPYADTVQDGKPVFAIGGRIYTYHQKMSGTPFGLVHLYTCSGGENATITSLGVWDNPAGTDVLYASWSDGTNHGIDIISDDEKEEAVIVTPVFEYTQESSHMQRDAKVQQEPQRVQIHYYDMPEGCDLEVELNVNNRGWAKYSVKHEASRMLYTVDKMPYVLDNNSKGRAKNAHIRTIQVRVIMKPNGSATPQIRYIEIL